MDTLLDHHAADDGLPYEFDFYRDGRLHRKEIPLEDCLLKFR